MMRRQYIVVAAVLLVLAAGFVGIKNVGTIQAAQAPTGQVSNPNYPKPNPLYFEGKIDWDLLKITQPTNAWQYMEFGIHEQDDLNNIPAAIQAYQTAYSMNNVQNGTCQYATVATLVNGQLPNPLNPPECFFTLRLRLGHLLQETDPGQAITLFQQVMKIDPIRLGVNELIGDTYVIEAEQAAGNATQQQADYQSAIQAYQAELALSPVTPIETKLTDDQANDAHVHWKLAHIYETLGQNTNAVAQYQQYLLATKWHSDVYPWRISLAKVKIQQLGGP